MSKLQWGGLFLLSILLTACAFSADPTAPVVDRSLITGHKSDSYIVRSGDTLYSIAWSHGVDYRRLASINELSSPYTLTIGERLWVKPGVASQSAVSAPSAIEIKRLHWGWPATGTLIQGFSSAAFGNTGINIAGKRGSPIRATANGVVVYSGAGVRGYGNLLIVKHNPHYLTAYAFNLCNLVKDGTRVHKGQKIAEMGQDNSGRVMLHFEIRHDGRPVDPLIFLHSCKTPVSFEAG